MITALVTVGEGYHNFHHQFPMDYRNAIKWYQYDPTKWFIWTMKQLGLASHLKVFPENEIRKGQLAMSLKTLHETQEDITWPSQRCDLPVVNWDTCTLDPDALYTSDIDFVCRSRKIPRGLTHPCLWFHTRRLNVPRRAPWWSAPTCPVRRKGRHHRFFGWSLRSFGCRTQCKYIKYVLYLVSHVFSSSFP